MIPPYLLGGHRYRLEATSKEEQRGLQARGLNLHVVLRNDIFFLWVPLLVTTSKALVTRSDALVTSRVVRLSERTANAAVAAHWAAMDLGQEIRKAQLVEPRNVEHGSIEKQNS